MARTSQRHSTAEISEQLGMQYAFGVEFHELGLGDLTERAFCTDDFNALGWHGNAIRSSVPIEQISMLRLEDHGHWFTYESGASDPDQPRVGGRMAIIAVVTGKTGPLCVVSTHLKAMQMQSIAIYSYPNYWTKLTSMPLICGCFSTET